ncbi:EEF1A lysine methyltransferase 1 [Blattella germanica]|nr:EEF1A lysine methyltransferase 1 [Blattella germanica]PSN39303.1 EEF1A lysine methyltransferase 1 [Blattella germanica]
MSESDDDTLQLSTEALAALQEFYAQKAEKEEQLRCILEGSQIPIKNIDIDEDWQLSQFWYDDETAAYLSSEALRLAGSNGKIALVSCPTLYKTLKSQSPNHEVSLFEFDKRFAAYGEDFILYDYKSPLDIPRHLAGRFDVVVADPPFLSEECLTKTAVTIKFLAKSKIILCTGAKMEELACRLLDVKRSEFQPRHKNNLANEFCCFINYDTVK